MTCTEQRFGAGGASEAARSAVKGVIVINRRPKRNSQAREGIDEFSSALRPTDRNKRRPRFPRHNYSPCPLSQVFSIISTRPFRAMKLIVSEISLLHEIECEWAFARTRKSHICRIMQNRRNYFVSLLVLWHRDVTLLRARALCCNNFTM